MSNYNPYVKYGDSIINMNKVNYVVINGPRMGGYKIVFHFDNPDNNLYYSFNDLNEAREALKYITKLTEKVYTEAKQKGSSSHSVVQTSNITNSANPNAPVNEEFHDEPNTTDTVDTVDSTLTINRAEGS